MIITQVGKIASGQDGAIWGKYLFRFNAAGIGRVYDLDSIGAAAAPLEELATFQLDRTDILIPHSNAVMFGCDYYSPDDEFPLLYSNIYNNHAKKEDPLKGVCCVYRLQRQGENFSTTLVQLIEIGFVNDSRLWSSSDENNDVRPFGNFAIDRRNGIYYAFTMRDACNATRYFSFRLPKLSDGVADGKWNVPKVTLQPSDIIGSFDCEYHHFIQGACTHNGKIYSLEGFTSSEKNPPALRVICPETKKQELCVPFADHGLTIEPEFIDFRDDTCYYSDNAGNLYVIEF